MGAVERQKKPGQAWETVAADTGQNSLITPNVTGTGEDSGAISLVTGDAVDGNCGGITIETGVSANGDGGDIVMQPGLGTGSTGQIFMRNANGLVELEVGINGVYICLQGGELGFFGGPSAGQPVVPQTTPGIQDVINALVSIGLIDQHD